MDFNNKKFDYISDAPFDTLLSSVSSQGIKVTAIAVPEDAVTSEERPYDYIELPDGIETIIAISEKFIQDLMKESKSDFSKGYTLGMFVNHLLQEKLTKLLGEDE
jgi:hypothetical protein